MRAACGLELSLDRDSLQGQLVDTFHRSEGDGKILDREARRVEHGHFILASASFGLADEHRAELRNVFALELPSLQGVDELPVVARLLSVVHKRKIIELCSG